MESNLEDKRVNSDFLIFFVNGKKVVEENPNPEWTLLHYLRFKLRLVGSKEGCGEGGCGACTVMQSRFDPVTKTISNGAVNACLTPLCSVHGTAIITVEGIGNTTKGLHPVQERIAKSHGTQCGFCTPGFVMSMYALLRNNPKPTEHEMEEAFQGNLCRCTGYRPIMEGFKTLCCKSEGSKLSNGNGCCMQNGTIVSNGKCCKEYDVTLEGIADVLFEESEFLPYDPTMDIIFPPELQLNDSIRNKSLQFVGPSVTWYKPQCLYELLQLKKVHPKAKLVAGNTEIGVDVKFKRQFYPRYIQINDISELTKIERDIGFVKIGAALTLSQLEKFCESELKKNSRHDGTVFNAIKEILRWFGGQQIRNVATVGGNLITASPISDLNPIFIAANCSATLISSGGTRTVPIDDSFFKSYRTTVIQEDEILLSITLPLTAENEYIWAIKQARRREDDIAIVTSCMRIKLDPKNLIVEESRLVYGGMGPTTILAKKSSKVLTGKKWHENLVQEVANSLTEDLLLSPDAPGGMIAYRLSLAPSFFFKFFLAVSSWISKNGWNFSLTLDKRDLSSIESCSRGETHGVQLYQIVPKEQKVNDLVGRPIVHLSGLKHATGEATYIDDIPPTRGELYGCLVLSSIAYGTILSIDSSEALQLSGVVLFLDAKSISQSFRNIQGFIVDDEEVFASKEVTCVGQIIGYIVAEDPLLAEKAAKLIRVTYDEKPPIVTIEQAIEHNSYHCTRKLQFGDPDTAFQNCDKIIEGKMRIGGQEHFYMETQSCIATPKEENEMDLQIGAQGIHYIQKQVARCLGVPENRVTVRCRRIGGAFGGKESRNVLIALATCIAAKKLNLPVRTVMNRHDDMLATGGRHPFLCHYKVGFSKEGRISVIKATMYSNAGNSQDGSTPVMERALMSFDAAYSIPNWDLYGYVCKTNLPSNTAFRGYGGPQASIFCENIIDTVADTLGMSSLQIRTMHLKKEGEIVPSGWKLENVTLKRCWDECIRNSDYEMRKKQVEDFNRKNKWKKRGIAVMPMKHDLGFTTAFMNQAGALVMIYTDGSVSLNFGGTEMGQGLATKMVQVACRVLDIPASKIYFSESCTDKVPNAIATCGSLSSDLNGMAVMKACEKLIKRLSPFKKSNPKGKWEEWVSTAYLNRVNLSASGFFEMSHLSYDFEDKTNQKDPYNYSVFGVACSEVEIDCLTGDHSVLRVDIVIDAGESLNPAVDVGQIEGAFVQGYGLFCMEELLYSPKGHMLTRGPGMYKIPAMGDIPRQFYVSLLRGAPNPKAVYSSKGLGEPPLFLSASVYLAIKEAIKSVRKENGQDTVFRFDCPATAEKIRLACPNEFTKSPSTPSDLPTWAVVV